MIDYKLLAKEMAQQFNKLYDTGLKLECIAHAYNLSVSTISLYIWKPRKPGMQRVVTKDIGKQIGLLRCELWRVKDIVGMLQISESTIYKYLRG